MRYRLHLAAALLFAVAAGPLVAEVKLPSIFSDHMVLQRGRPVPVWGWDTPGTKVTVKVAGKSASAVANKNGKFTVKVPELTAGGPFTLTVEGTSAVAVKDVLVGEVWFCSGQSNMEWSVDRSKNKDKEIADANWMKIRHIKIPHVTADKPQKDVKSTGWQPATSKNVAKFTAVGYFFARHLHKELKGVPIGIIGCNWGGTRIEPWTPPVGFKSVPELKELADNLDKYPSKRGNRINHQSPLAIYNAMVAPLVPYGMRGALWYQGESNNGEGMLYHHKMKALINGWRTLWNDKELPFYFVQLAPFRYGRRDVTDLPGIWEAQSATLKVPHTGMAVTVDISNIRNIHPANKQDVGKRLALWALAKNYGQDDLVYSGPLYKSMKAEGGKVRITFDHLGGGLTARDGKALNSFTIAAKDKKFVAAQAKIDGNSVVVWADSVVEPVAVRFGWTDTSEPNLSNKAGLPASPFRTDNWK